MRFFWILIVLITPFSRISAQYSPDSVKPPRLVVGIIVDQMRYDFLYRYWEKYSENGFKRLLREGRSFENTHYNYVPTLTGPGHAAIYTGTTPAVNGIIGNDWYDRGSNKTVYVVEDPKANPVGYPAPGGHMSPRNLRSTTITDELKLFTNRRAKVIGISLKDRGAILPAGHLADAAIWFDTLSGNWISSDWYCKQLPDWLIRFNKTNLPWEDSILTHPWNLILGSVSNYTESTADKVKFELPYRGDTSKNVAFPYPLDRIFPGMGRELLERTPFGNTATTRLVEAALDGEQLGKGSFTDFLAVSYSSTDYVGHQFGPNSVETEDTYIRLDAEIAQLLDSLDHYLPKDQYLVFLTADHGVVPVPALLDSLKIPAGILPHKVLEDTLVRYLKSVYGPGDWVLKFSSNQQVYLNHKLAVQDSINPEELDLKTARLLQGFKGVAYAFTANEVRQLSAANPWYRKLQLGYHAERSGDVLIQLDPAWFDYPAFATGGTTHGAPYAYDTHVPLIWYGWQVAPGQSNESVEITDIAPTIAAILHILEPNGSIGRVLELRK